MTRIADNGPILHGQKMLFSDDVDVTGQGAEKVPQRRSLGDGHHLVTVHHRLECPQGVHFTNDDMGAVPLGTKGDASPAPTISADHEGAARQKPVGRPDNAVHRALARAVTVIKKVFRVGIVDRYNGKP